MSLESFHIKIPQETLDDLKKRLERTRWPDEVKGSGWSMGTNLDYMKELADYWQHKYDWRKHEAKLNKFNQFKTKVDGTEIHFIHERSKNPNSTPIILLHGWPDSFYRFHKVIRRLTDPARYGGDPNNSFDVIVPSIPGIGFSERRAMAPDALADLFAKLMTEVLGYKKFVSAGGDGGTLITKSLALNHPDVLIGIHLTDVGYPDMNTDFASLSPAEREFAGFIQQWWMKEGAFNMIQSTKPQTLAYGMNDSPVGLAAWIMGFICAMSTCEEIEKRFGRDELLTNIMIYWVTETIGSSFRWYYEMAHAPPSPKQGQRSEVPAAVAHCPWDAPLPREWAERNVNLKHFTEFDRGGHFAAWEEPEIYAKDVQDFVAELRK
ncbi:MAG TPA: epoxide hydrolase [Methanotrichaceae archaeon]|nr:epoxide hydrolase [Methanotrichaceae archaeon]